MILDRFHTIRNPLTVIAIFAALAEAFSCLALPKLSPDVQRVFVWFVITFPAVLVLLFFATLNWNHKVLYAPSDFKSDDTFLRTFERHAAEIKHDLLKQAAEVFGELVTISLTDAFSLIGRDWRPPEERFANEKTRLEARNKIVGLMRSSRVEAAKVDIIVEQYDKVITKNVKGTFASYLHAYVHEYARNYSVQEIEKPKPGGGIIKSSTIGDPKRRDELCRKADSQELKSLPDTACYDVSQIATWLRQNDLYGGQKATDLLAAFASLQKWMADRGLVIR